MPTNEAVKVALAAYCAKHDLPIPAWVKNAVWGDGAKVMAWRVSTHAGLHPSTQKTDALCNLLLPPNVHTEFRAAVLKGYNGLLGVKEGSGKQKEIAAFCGLSSREPWCAETAWYVAKHEAGYNGAERPENIAYVPSWEMFARAHNLLVPNGQWLPGMFVTFVWDYAKYVGSGDHIGIIADSDATGHRVLANPRTEEGNAGGPGGVDAVIATHRSASVINCVIDLARLQR